MQNRVYWTDASAEPEKMSLNPGYVEHSLETTATHWQHLHSNCVVRSQPHSLFGPQFALLQDGNNSFSYFTGILWGPNEELYTSLLCELSSSPLIHSIIILLSWICKDTAILLLWKDLPWKPKLKTESSIIRLPLQPVSIHVPHTHSHWRWWLYFASTETPTFSFVSHQDNSCSKDSASST